MAMITEQGQFWSDFFKAIAEGKTVQVKTVDGWKNLNLTCLWGMDLNAPTHYRIKPAPAYRPFKDGEELVAEYCKRFGVKRKAWEMPNIWVKCGGTCKFLISVIDTGAIAIDDDTISFDSLVSVYTFLDGSPCGVEEAGE